LQTSDALGAAASQLGPNAQAAVVDLNKQAGLSHGKVTQVLHDLFGIDLTRGGSAHTVLRAGRRCEGVIQSLLDAMPQVPQANLDETGWRVGGRLAWLHTVVSPHATVYLIDPTRSGDVAERVLGLDYPGILGHDGWSPYDRFEHARHQQCLAHRLRRCDELLQTATGGAALFPRRVKSLLQQALDLRDRHQAGHVSDHGVAAACGHLTNRLADLVSPTKRHEANHRLAQHLWNHPTRVMPGNSAPARSTASRAAAWAARACSASGGRAQQRTSGEHDQASESPIKGSQTFWLKGGAEAVLQVRAAYLSQDDRARRFWDPPRPYARSAGAKRLRPAA
jgi:hypothetical protein